MNYHFNGCIDDDIEPEALTTNDEIKISNGILLIADPHVNDFIDIFKDVARV